MWNWQWLIWNSRKQIKGGMLLKQCEICGTTKGAIYSKGNKFGKELCSRHYLQMQKHGKIIEQTKYDLNKIVIKGDITEVIICNNDQTEVARALMDSKYYDLIKNYKWSLGTDNYIISKPGRKSFKIHRLITNAPRGMVVDHINHNPLDNRLENLRVCTNQENMRNRGLVSNNTSGYTGVCWVKASCKWIARITVSGKLMTLGTYSDINDAIAVRKAAVEKYFGEYAYKEPVEYLCPTL
jgi:hypothetical protein